MNQSCAVAGFKAFMVRGVRCRLVFNGVSKSAVVFLLDAGCTDADRCDHRPVARDGRALCAAGEPAPRHAVHTIAHSRIAPNFDQSQGPPDHSTSVPEMGVCSYGLQLDSRDRIRETTVTQMAETSAPAGEAPSRGRLKGGRQTHHVSTKCLHHSKICLSALYRARTRRVASIGPRTTCSHAAWSAPAQKIARARGAPCEIAHRQMFHKA